MIESKSQKLRRNHTQRLPKSKSQERNLKVALQLQGSRQVAEHDNTKIVKKDQYLSHRETEHVSQYYSTKVSGPQR